MRSARGAVAAVGVVLALQFALLTALASVVGTWQDDEYTLATTAHGIAYAWERAIVYELQAPLYFAVVAALRPLDFSPFFARMLSVVAACATTALVALIAARVRPRRSPVVFAALFAANPFVVYAALEIRVYALALLVSAALWLAFDLGYLSDRRFSARIALVTLAICATYVQYFLVFELAGFAVALAVLRRPGALVRYLASLFPVALAFLPLGFQLKAQVGGAFSVPTSLPGAYGSIFVHPWLDFAFPLDYQVLLGGAAHAVTLLLLVAVAALVVAGRPQPAAYATAAVATAVTVEALYAVVADVLHYELIVPRHFVALLVPETLAFYAVVCAFGARHALRYAAALAALVGFAAAASLFADYRALAKQGDWARVGAMLTAQTRPGDVVAVFEADALAPFERYYHGPAKVVPLPRALPADRYDVSDLVVRSQADAATALARLPRTGRLWIVRAGVCDRFDFYGCLELRAALAARYRVVEHRAFYLNDVERVVPLAEPVRSGAP